MNRLDPGTLSPTAIRIYGAAVVVAPMLLLASTVAYITEGGGINDGVLGGTIGVWSCFALVIAFVGLLRLLEPVAPKAAPIVAVVALIGFTAGVAFNIQAIFTAHFGPEIGEFIETVEGSDAVAVLAFLPWGWFVPATFVATGMLLWRTRSCARWAAGLLTVSGVLFIASRPARIEWLAVISDVTLLLALIPIGLLILTRSRTDTPAGSTTD